MVFAKTYKNVIRIVIATAFTPVLLGSSCPFFPGTATLLSESKAATPQNGGFADTCATATGLIQSTFLADANKPVTVKVTGPSTASRPEIIVADNQQNSVANTGTTPSTQSITTTFTPTSTNTYTLFVVECGANITGNYTLLVTQAAF